MMSESEKILRQRNDNPPTMLNATKIQDKNNVFLNMANYISERMDLRYNSVRLMTEYRRRGSNGAYSVFADREKNSLYISMKEDNQFKFAQSDYNLYIQSERIPSYDPYREYFESLPPYTGDPIRELAQYIEVEEARGYYFAIQLKKWLVRVVKCALEENYFNKQILVFVGEEQNTGKTSFCRWLCPPALGNYWSEEAPSGKDESIQLSSNFLILYDELVKLNKTSEAEVKTVLSKTLLKYRPPYDRMERVFTRRCSFLGNCNEMQFLTDPSGSVRFLAFLLKKINFAYRENCNIDAIYSQAYHLYLEHFDCDMNQYELKAQAEYNKRFFVSTTEHDMILEYMRPASPKDINTYGQVVYYWQAGQILLFLQDNMPNLKFNLTSLGKALKFLGFERIAVKVNAVTKRVYPLVLVNDGMYIRSELKLCTKNNQAEVEA